MVFVMLQWPTFRYAKMSTHTRDKAERNDANTVEKQLNAENKGQSELELLMLYKIIIPFIFLALNPRVALTVAVRYFHVRPLLPPIITKLFPVSCFCLCCPG